MYETNEGICQVLQGKADLEKKYRKTSCVLLGARIEESRFEPNPAKWAGRAKTSQLVWFEYPGVSLGSGTPYRVSIQLNHLLYDGRSIPHNPLMDWAFSRATFSIEFFNDVATNVREGIAFAGITYENDRPHIDAQLPRDGEDIQDEPVYWKLPGGSVVCWSVRKLSQAKDDELEEKGSMERYTAVAKELGYDVLGKAMDDNELEEFQAEPGTLEQKHWKRVAWVEPLDDSLPCWFLANAAEADRTQEVKLVCRSLVGLEMQLRDNRCATSANQHRLGRLKGTDTTDILVAKSVDLTGAHHHVPLGRP